jgi:hypothetical protein
LENLDTREREGSKHFQDGARPKHLRVISRTRPTCQHHGDTSCLEIRRWHCRLQNSGCLGDVILLYDSGETRLGGRTSAGSRLQARVPVSAGRGGPQFFTGLSPRPCRCLSMSFSAQHQTVQTVHPIPDRVIVSCLLSTQTRRPRCRAGLAVGL